MLMITRVVLTALAAVNFGLIRSSPPPILQPEELKDRAGPMIGARRNKNMIKNKKRLILLPKDCKHPSHRLYCWYAYDGVLCIGCCQCGKVLKGGV